MELRIENFCFRECEARKVEQVGCNLIWSTSHDITKYSHLVRKYLADLKSADKTSRVHTYHCHIICHIVINSITDNFINYLHATYFIFILYEGPPYHYSIVNNILSTIIYYSTTITILYTIISL